MKGKANAIVCNLLFLTDIWYHTSHQQSKIKKIRVFFCCVDEVTDKLSSKTTDFGKTEGERKTEQRQATKCCNNGVRVQGRSDIFRCFAHIVWITDKRLSGQRNTLMCRLLFLMATARWNTSQIIAWHFDGRCTRFTFPESARKRRALNWHFLGPLWRCVFGEVSLSTFYLAYLANDSCCCSRLNSLLRPFVWYTWRPSRLLLTFSVLFLSPYI